MRFTQAELDDRNVLEDSMQETAAPDTPPAAAAPFPGSTDCSQVDVSISLYHPVIFGVKRASPNWTDQN